MQFSHGPRRACPAGAKVLEETAAGGRPFRMCKEMSAAGADIATPRTALAQRSAKTRIAQTELPLRRDKPAGGERAVLAGFA